MCSVCAVVHREPGTGVIEDVLGLIYSGENRGSESVGAAFFDGELHNYKRMRAEGGIGALKADIMEELAKGKLREDRLFRSVGQTRYSTSGESTLEYAQPFEIVGRSRFVINHNGTIPNAREIVKRYELPVKTQSDTEAIGRLIARSPDIVEGIEKATQEILGGWNLSLLDDRGTVYLFRDPRGYSPLWYQDDGRTLLAASEDSALYALLRFNPVEVKPGELIIAEDGRIEKRQLVAAQKTECPFEPIYFEKIGSTHRGSLVQAIRYKIGQSLGRKETVLGEDVVVVPVMDSGRFYAEGLADAAGLSYQEGLMKNRGERVYMIPEGRSGGAHAGTRRQRAKLKNVAIPQIVRAKRIIVTDDSIVRSDTATGITENLREAGAREVHWRIGFPPIRYGCIYKMDHQIKAELIAAKAPDPRRIGEFVAKRIGANSVIYAEWLDDIAPAVKDEGDHCTACFTGNYPTRIPLEARAAIEP